MKRYRCAFLGEWHRPSDLVGKTGPTRCIAYVNADTPDDAKRSVAKRATIIGDWAVKEAD